MTCTEEYREHIEYTFHAFCKVVIRNATINAARTRSRKHKREISLEYLTDEKHYPLGTTDEYFQATEPDEEYILTLCGDTIRESGVTNTKYRDIPVNAWYGGYIKYLTNYGVLFGYEDNTFRPNDKITRAEFTVMAVRFFEAYGDGNSEIVEKYTGFDDLSSGYWAAEYIKDAAIHGWIQGYGDGSFHGERKITRAEVVTIVNRLLGRVADEEYINDNIRRLNTFTDMYKKHWAYYDVMEAANAHTATFAPDESWSK